MHKTSSTCGIPGESAVNISPYSHYVLFSILGPSLSFLPYINIKTFWLWLVLAQTEKQQKLLYSLQTEYGKQLCVQNVKTDHHHDGISDSPQVLTKTLRLSGARRILSHITGSLSDLAVR